MSVFEILMMVCFGFAWPFSIIKSYRSRSTQGKSAVFLFIVLLGYTAGIIHKLLYRLDGVIVFYCINSVLVSLDIILYFRNLYLEKKSL